MASHVPIHGKLQGKATSSIEPPWEDWKFDKAFFKALSQYAIDHPETVLDRILDKVRIGLNNNKELFELIPESPFPARGLVKALAHLFLLGVTVSRAKKAVHEFSNQVVTWVLDVKSAFESPHGGYFTWVTWKNLQKMRDLIDEICTWAHARLNDKRWSRIGNGMMIGNEIAEFNSRIADAKGLFRDLTIINVTGGIDTILATIGLLLHRQNKITREIAKIREKQAEQFKYIVDELEAQKQAEARRLFLSQTLSLRVVANPTYDQQGKNPCDEDTRTEVLAEIMQWVNDVLPGSQNFLWLTGDPGCGKSAITASIARECKDEGVLWAQFFINRNNVETTDPNSYFPSIARQLVDQSLDVEQAIYETLKKKPSLMDRISPEQAAKLFIDAIGIASKVCLERPVVIVIDGLDETDRKCLKDTAIIFSLLFKGLSSYQNAKVFVSSRTEDDIRNPFARNMNDKHVKHVHLDTSAQSSIDDVSAFLRRKVVRIVEENDLNWTVWPGEERMAALAVRASGLFIWAVTAAKFLQEQIDTMGTECLDVVLNMLTAEALCDINALYNLILRLTHKDEANAWEIEKFCRIVGAIVVLREPLCLEDLAGLLNLRQTASSPPVDVIKFTRRLRTVLVAGTDAIDNQTIPRLHKSFFEFITSREVDPRFRIDSKTADGELAVRCFRQFCDSLHMIPGLPVVNTILPGRLRYACRFWSSHLHYAEGVSSGVAIDDYTLSLSDLQQLITFSSNRDNMAALHLSFSSDRSQILTSLNNQIRFWEMAGGQEVKSALSGHTDQVTSVAFSPDGNWVISGSLDSTLILWDSRTGEPVGRPLGGHSGAVHTVTFSPSGNHIVSGSDDKTIRLWNSQKIQTIQIFMGHTGAVKTVACSPDGKYIVSGSDDNTIRLWDVEDGSPIGSPWTGHTEPIDSVAFSPDGHNVISGSQDGAIRLWSMQDGQHIGEPIRYYQRVWSVAFSPNGKQILSSRGSGDKAISFWAVNRHRLMFTGSLPQSPLVRTRSIAFSPDGNTIVLGSDDHHIHLLDAQTRQPIIPPFIGHTDSVLSVAFSPNGKQIVSGSGDKTVRIWNVPNGLAPIKSYDEYGTRFTAFSPDGMLILSASLDGTGRLWDLRRAPAVGHVLQGNFEQHRCLAFSPDGTCLAAVLSDGSIALWDITTYQLIAVDFPLPSAVSVSFAADSRILIATFTDETTHALKAECGKLVHAPWSSDSNSLDSEPSFFDVWERDRNNCGLEYVQWFPAKKQDSGLWAFLDYHIIRARTDGSITIVPVTRPPPKPSFPLSSHSGPNFQVIGLPSPSTFPTIRPPLMSNFQVTKLLQRRKPSKDSVLSDLSFSDNRRFTWSSSGDETDEFL